MRLSNALHQQKQLQALDLFNQGKSNKQIASELKVTEKTVGIWLKPLRMQSKQLQEAKTNIIKRINKALIDNEAPSVIKDLTYSLTLLKSI